MPKAAPDKVIVVRFEMQETERRILEQAVTAYSIRSVSKGVYNLTSDMTTVLILIVVYEMITDSKVLGDAILLALGAGEDIGSALLQAWRDYRQTEEYRGDYHERAHSVTGGLRNLLDNIIGALTGEHIGTWYEQQE